MSFWIPHKSADGRKSIYVVTNLMPYLLLLPVVIVVLLGAFKRSLGW